MRGSILVNPKRCLSCKRCLFYCAVAHSSAQDLLGALEDPTAQPRVSLLEVAGAVIPVRCYHCDGAPCTLVCPSGAIHRREMGAPVVIDQERCVGCGSCTIVCPYGIPERSRSGRALIKCDLCVDRLERGERPACVSACPTGALEFKELEVSEEAPGRVEFLLESMGGAP